LPTKAHRSGWIWNERISKQRTALEHYLEKHALGLDPMGGCRFSEKDHAPPKIWSAMSIPPKVIAL
jgi:hypothetical protein